ncbi:hypothetical protein Ga0003345_0590 [Idiomarinaceae bacterium HL-53]|nr:hypothetical protein Ga0003345_0590 [Idiomarinaceae bacterium HL-53]
MIDKVFKYFALRMLCGSESLTIARVIPWEVYFSARNGSHRNGLLTKQFALEDRFSATVNFLGESSNLSIPVLERAMSILTGENTQIRDSEVLVNYFGQKVKKPEPSSLKGLLAYVGELDKSASSLIGYLKVYRALNLAHAFKDKNGTLARAYFLSRAGYINTFVLLYRSGRNKDYADSNYLNIEPQTTDKFFDKYWNRAIEYSNEIQELCERQIKLINKELSSSGVMFQLDKSQATILNAPFDCPSIPLGNTSLNLNSNLFKVSQSGDFEYILSLRPAIRLYIKLTETLS